MQRSFRKRKKLNPSLILSVFVLLTMPLAIYSLVSDQNFDIRNLAYDDSEAKNCTILIPYVNTKTLEINTEYNALIYANFEDEEVESVEVFENGNKSIFSENFNNENKISETFTFRPSELGEYNITGQIQTNSGTHSCQMFEGQNLIYIVEENKPPVFLTAPFLSDDSMYEYNLEARDDDLDEIHYAYSFEPRAHWINKTVIENGKSGNLHIQFSGIPEAEGKYKASVFLHDGHGQNMVQQSWDLIVDEGKIKEVEELEESDVVLENGNQIFLPIPQVISMHPEENAYTTNFETKISANLVASRGSGINEKDIVFKVNDSNLTQQTHIMKISDGEFFVEYEPTEMLDSGEHRAYIYFKDSQGFETDKEWTFTIESEFDEETFLGFPITSVVIFSIGILLVIFAISIPWILYIAWKKDQTEDYEEIPIIKPEGESSFKKSFEKKK